MSTVFHAQRSVTVLAGLLAVTVLSACISGSRLVDHAFSFDAITDTPEVEVLDYRYGDSRQPGARNPEYLLKEGRSLQRTGIHGEMRRGDFLYVKWRIKATGGVHEDTVDLRDRLPANITDHRIYFMIKGPQLYVYLIPPEGVKRPKDKAPNGPAKYGDLDTVTIYPDRAK